MLLPQLPMAIAPPTLHCANARCQSPHEGEAAVCRQCGTPLLRRYLWVVGDAALTQQTGQLLQERYWVVAPKVVLDTQPGMLPEVPEVGDDLPETFLPYLHLFHQRSAIPQVYGVLQGAAFLLEAGPLEAHRDREQASLFKGEQPPPPGGSLMPRLDQAWAKASPQRQLGWLWQMARLWSPMLREGVGQTLLEPELLRVDGSQVRVLELRHQGQEAPTLSQLGGLWQQWLSQTQASVAPFLQGLSERMLAGTIETTEQLVPLLDRALAIAAEKLTTELHVATCTDSGPHRSHNEDACLPAGGTFRLTSSGPKSITLVCDGLGGHDGGEIASLMAAETIHRYVQTPQNLEGNSPGLVMQQAFYVANDELIERNNDEKRLQRQRMGTTVTAAWMMNHLFYLGHVGDSRIYRITPTTCQQLTVDDDVASQSVMQGQNVHRHAVRPSTSGSLTQALGITNSSMMRPTVQRYFFDEDTVLLLCSDGLSDHDRVEEVWQNTVLPTLTQNLNVAVTASRLLEVANQRNGHDNATIALVHYKITDRQPPDPDGLLKLLEPWPLSGGVKTPTRPQKNGAVPFPRRKPAKTRQAVVSKKVVVLLSLLVAMLGAVGVGVWRMRAQPEPTTQVTGPTPVNR